MGPKFEFRVGFYGGFKVGLGWVLVLGGVCLGLV